MEPTTPLPTTPDPGEERRHPIRAALIVAALVGLGLAAAYGVSEWVDPVYGAPRKQFDRAVAAGPAVQALSLGNSHGRALNFEVLGLRAADIRSSGGDHYESLHIARAVRPHLPDLEYVFVTLSMFVSDNSTEISRQEVRKQAYVITGDYTPMSGDRTEAFAARLSPIIRTDNWEGVVAKVVKQLKGGGREARRRRGRPSPERTAEEIRESAGSRAALHRTWQQHSLDANPALCEESRAALRELARLSAPARVVLYTPPYPPAYLRHFEEPTGCGLDRLAAELAASSPHVLYFDDRTLPPFEEGSGYFRDGDHLNPTGAEAYSEILAERLGLR